MTEPMKDRWLTNIKEESNNDWQEPDQTFRNVDKLTPNTEATVK